MLKLELKQDSIVKWIVSEQGSNQRNQPTDGSRGAFKSEIRRFFIRPSGRWIGWRHGFIGVYPWSCIKSKPEFIITTTISIMISNGWIDEAKKDDLKMKQEEDGRRNTLARIGRTALELCYLACLRGWMDGYCRWLRSREKGFQDPRTLLAWK